jgi:hypothetical protein
MDSRWGLDLADSDRLGDAAPRPCPSNHEAMVYWLQYQILRIAEDAFSLRGRSFVYTDVYRNPDLVVQELRAARHEIAGQ